MNYSGRKLVKIVTDLNKTTDPLDLIDIYRISHTNLSRVHICVSISHGMFTEINYIQAIKYIIKLKKLKNIQSLFQTSVRAENLHMFINYIEHI